MPRKKGSKNGGNVTCKPNGTYLMRIVFNGENMSTIAKGAKTEAQARKMMNAWIAELEAGRAAEPTKITLGQYYEQWLEEKKQELHPLTCKNYKANFKNHVRPFLGRKRLQEITRKEIQDILYLMANKGLSLDTIRLTLRPLQQALQAAVDREGPLLTRNPAKGVKLSKKLVKTEPRLKQKALTIREFGLYLNVVQGHKWELLFELLVTTGIRMGEARALRWSDLDTSTGLLTVRRSVSIPKINGRFLFKGTKTADVRTIKLHKELLSRLRERFQGDSTVLIFGNAKGEPASHRSILKCHRELCVRAGISPDITLHSLRHTCVTLLGAKGENLKAIQHQVGHATSGQTTEQVYYHVLPSMRDRVAETMSELLNEARELAKDAA